LSTSIFIVGNSRSGTTMMGRILGRHPNIFTFRELHFFEQLCSVSDVHKTINVQEAIQLFSRLIALQRDGYLLVKMIRSEYIEEATQHLKNIGLKHQTYISIYKLFLEYEAKLNGKYIPCEQTPRNLLFLKEILDFYGACARVLVMVRDPRDVLLSQKNKWRRKLLGMPELPWHESFRTWINYHPIVISMLWLASIKEADAYKMEDRVRHIKFESFLESPKEELKGICDFLQIDFIDDLLTITMRDSSSQMDSVDQVGIDKRKIGQWQVAGLNDAEIFLCQSILGTNMKAHGYEKKNIEIRFMTVLLVTYYLFSLAIKLPLAFLLNLYRMKSPLESIALRVRRLVLGN
jgi:omega-hydroxy-beta-dihydromenaquinone-9 sulfotransferase